MDLEPKLNQAICEEIGERLRTGLSREHASMPFQLRQLLHQLEEADSRLAARFSPLGTYDRDITDDLDIVALLRGRDGARSEDVDKGGELAPANEMGDAARVPKPAKVRILPPDEIFLGLTIASIVLLFEVGILVLLAK
jgi:hypothetical protein